MCCRADYYGDKLLLSGGSEVRRSIKADIVVVNMQERLLLTSLRVKL